MGGGVFGGLWPDFSMHHEFTLSLLGLIVPLRGGEVVVVMVVVVEGGFSLQSPLHHQSGVAIFRSSRCMAAAEQCWPGMMIRVLGGVCVCLCTIQGSSISVSLRI